MRSVDYLVIIPTFRRPGSLLEAIASVQSQAGVSTQIIVADDCPDGSAASVKRDFAKVIYLKNPDPSGGWPGRVRNYAFAQSEAMGLSARFVHFLDDDDVVPPGLYQDVAETFDRHPDKGVIFGVLRPFCVFSGDTRRQQRQHDLLHEVRAWRIYAGRFPWLFQDIGARTGIPAVTQLLMRQHALFGPEMFLCSGGIIRYQHVRALGGFPDVRITQDYWFYTDAIRKFGGVFLKRASAGYGVGDSGAVWNPLDLAGAAKQAHTQEWMGELRARQRQYRTELGSALYYFLKVLFVGQRLTLRYVVMPLLDRRGYFNALYRLTSPDYAVTDPTRVTALAPVPPIVQPPRVPGD